MLHWMIGAFLADGIVPGRWAPRTARCSLPDVPDQDARSRDRHRQRQAVADLLPAARPGATARRSALCDERGAQREPRAADRAAAGGVPHEDLRGVGGDPGAGRDSRWARSTRSTRSSRIRRSRARRSSSTTHPVAGTVRMIGAPVRLSETPGAVRAAGAAARPTHRRGAERASSGSATTRSPSAPSGRGRRGPAVAIEIQREVVRQVVVTERAPGRQRTAGVEGARGRRRTDRVAAPAPTPRAG